MIELKDVSRKYTLGGEVINALDTVNLGVPEGQFVAIMGPSGSGKSTFLHLIGGLDRPDAGTITVGGKKLGELSDKKRAKYRNQTIGFIFQSFNLQSTYTALENVMLPLYFSKIKQKEKKNRAKEMLKIVGLEARMKNKPSELSGGEQQRVAIARALVSNPSILLADEPTGNLDSKNGQIIMKLLEDLNKKQGVTIIMVTHDKEMSSYAQKTYKIKDGKLS